MRVMGFLAAALLVPVAVALAGCEFSLGGYVGPRPDGAALVNEVVVIRRLGRPDGDPERVAAFFADRVRFVAAGDPHNVNRIVQVTSGELETDPHLAGAQVGDTLRITTRYDRTYYTSVSAPVPDWPGHDHYEYPIAYHTLVAVGPPE
jgi:hypothetical protein